MKPNKIILGVVGGAATGVLLGVLFAPKKGSETRKSILKKSHDYADGAKNKIETLLGSINKPYNNILQGGKHLIDEGKSKVDHTSKNEVENLDV
jgi:gas vesicle protein